MRELYQPSSVEISPATSARDVDSGESATTDGSDHLDHSFWATGWNDAGQVVYFDPGFAQPQVMRSIPGKPYHLFYEYRGPQNRWHIGLTRAKSIGGPFDTHSFPILSPTGEVEDPDGKHIADPTVLYLEEQDPSWHMWFDMCDTEDVWRLGHATSSDGVNWQQETSDGRTKVALDLGVSGEWDDEMLHAPEAFVYKDEIRILYNAQGSGHTGFDGGLATVVETGKDTFELQKEGQVTNDATCSGWVQNRIQKPIQIGEVLYTIVGWDGNSDCAIIRSDDGGRSWEEITEFPYPMACSLIVEDGIIYGIGSDRHLIWKELPQWAAV